MPPFLQRFCVTGSQGRWKDKSVISPSRGPRTTHSYCTIGHTSPFSAPLFTGDRTGPIAATVGTGTFLQALNSSPAHPRQTITELQALFLRGPLCAAPHRLLHYSIEANLRADYIQLHVTTGFYICLVELLSLVRPCIPALV